MEGQWRDCSHRCDAIRGQGTVDKGAVNRGEGSSVRTCDD